MLANDAINILDVVVVCLLSVFMIIYFYWKKRTTYNNSVIGKYLIPAFIFRLIGWFFSIVLLLTYFEGRGDTFQIYFGGVLLLRDAFEGDFCGLLKYVFSSLSVEELSRYNIPEKYLNKSGTGQMARIGLVLSYFSFCRFLIISFICSLFGFWGSWRLYLFFCKFKPRLHKELAVIILLFPSIIFWGTGYMKEVFVLYALPIILNGFSGLMIMKRSVVFSGASFLFGCWLLVSIKAYILLALAPALLVWWGCHRLKRFKGVTLKIIVIPLFLIIAFLGLLLMSQAVAMKTSYLAVDNLVAEMESRMSFWEVQNYYGSSYNLPKVEVSVKGILGAMPYLFVTGSIRPFLWEAQSPIVMISAIECFFVTLFLLFVFLRLGILHIFKEIFGSPLLLFLMVFILILFPVVAMTSGNFGNLARYRMPILPFLLILVLFVYDSYRTKKMIIK